jgi:hypothetical protein
MMADVTPVSSWRTPVGMPSRSQKTSGRTPVVQDGRENTFSFFSRSNTTRARPRVYIMLSLTIEIDDGVGGGVSRQRSR